MSREIFWLVLTVAMTGLFWVPYILDRIMVRRLAGAMANPSLQGAIGMGAADDGRPC